MVLRTRAPAKINLTLHVLGRRRDGYHELESLVAFAGVCDLLELVPDQPLGLAVTGPTAEASGALGDNLVLKAVRALADRVPGLRVGAFRLTKRLPVGAGIGGGSSDAAAALRLLAQLNDISVSDGRLYEAARVTGADVPVCLDPRSRVMRGTGERLGAPLAPAPLFAVLVNPGVHLETRAVFARMGLEPGQDTGRGAHPLLREGVPDSAFREAVRSGRNDMEAAARELAPVISEVLDALSQAPGSLVARMSGSGSTCFGLFPDRTAARRAAAVLGRERPGWWVRATALR